jgi:hypothetical protein
VCAYLYARINTSCSRSRHTVAAAYGAGSTPSCIAAEHCGLVVDVRVCACVYSVCMCALITLILCAITHDSQAELSTAKSVDVHDIAVEVLALIYGITLAHWRHLQVCAVCGVRCRCETACMLCSCCVCNPPPPGCYRAQ